MNIVINVSVGAITATVDVTDAVPDSLDEMTTRAVVLIRSLCSDTDLKAAARETVGAHDDDEDD